MLPINMAGTLTAQMSNVVGKDEKKLLKLFKALSAENQHSLLAFAEFLASRDQDEATEAPLGPPPEPVYEPGPEDESVIKAIKRLGGIYSMIDRSLLLNETSSLMTRHLMQGVPARDVIVELELLFERSYKSMKDEPDGGTGS